MYCTVADNLDYSLAYNKSLLYCDSFAPRLHDLDGDSKLDGLELLNAISHSLEEQINRINKIDISTEERLKRLERIKARHVCKY